MSSTPLVGLVVEGPDDAQTIPALTDRILAHELPAVEEPGGSVHTYGGLDGKPFLAWSAVDDEVRRRPVPRRHGHFGGEPAIEDARTAWYALQCFVARDPPPSAVLLVRDSDGKPEERLKGLEQARNDRSWPFSVLIGVAHPMRECWVLAAFCVKSKAEKAALAALKKELGFDPTVRSDQLDASKKTAKKSPKRVLAKLTGGGEREAQCWTDADLEQLRSRGAENGLACFVREVEERLAPAFVKSKGDAVALLRRCYFNTAPPRHAGPLTAPEPQSPPSTMPRRPSWRCSSRRPRILSRAHITRHSPPGRPPRAAIAARSTSSPP